jgi:hypothetical protein
MSEQVSAAGIGGDKAEAFTSLNHLTIPVSIRILEQK